MSGDLDKLYLNYQKTHFTISTTTGNTDALVAAAGPGKKIRLVSYTLVCTAASTVIFKSATTALTGTMSFAANGVQSREYTPLGHMETAANEALNITVGGTGPVTGYGTAVIVTNPSQP